MIPTLCTALLLALSSQQGLDDNTVAKMLKDLAGGTKEDREAAVSSLSLLTLDQAGRFVAPVQDLLASKDPEKRTLGISAVRTLKLKELSPALQTPLKSPEGSRSFDTIYAISESRAEDLYPFLLDFYKTGSPTSRSIAAERLGACPFPAPIPPLLAALQSQDLDV